MTPHPFQPSSQIALICAVCAKGKTHPNHAGQGEVDPEEYQERLAVEQEGRQQAAQEESGYQPWPGTPGPIHAIPMPDNYFRIESNGTTTQIEISIPDAPREHVLMALLNFMEQIKGEIAQPEAPAPKKKK